MLGSFECECLPGYQGDGLVCLDIDECHHQLDVCKWNQKCVNLPGSYRCVCLEGFVSHGNQSCIDVNECAVPSKCQAQNALCKNTLGSYECVCRKGLVMYQDKCTGKHLFKVVSVQVSVDSDA